MSEIQASLSKLGQKSTDDGQVLLLKNEGSMPAPQAWQGSPMQSGDWPQQWAPPQQNSWGYPSSRGYSRGYGGGRQNYSGYRTFRGAAYNQGRGGYNPPGYNSTIVPCKNCGGSHSRAQRNFCPAFGVQCRGCFKIGHFQRFCLGGKRQGQSEYQNHYQNSGQGGQGSF